jgi:hypothetical protein
MYGSLHLRQLAFGFTCQLSDGKQDVKVVLPPEERFIHNLRFTMIFLYARNMKWEPLVLAPEGVIGPRTLVEYPKGALEGSPSAEADMIAARPGQVISWWSESG